ncbi:hypothetical protein SAVIM338S_01844 [Streptomyces avidinii]
MAYPVRLMSVLHDVPRRLAAADVLEDENVKNFKKATAVTMIAGGLLAAGAGVSSAHGGASAEGEALNSPGVVSGNQLQLPVHIPANVVGNTVNVIGLLNGAFGNTGVNA